MDLTNWTPLRDLDRLFNRMHPLALELDGDGPGLRLLDKGLTWRPTANITENKDEYVIKAELPEVEKEDIHLEVGDGRITLSGERKYEKKSEEEKQHRVESFYGKFERSFSLPTNVDVDSIRAESDKGVLTVHLPKKSTPESSGRKIDVG
jgi:HSP20 family protein